MSLHTDLLEAVMIAPQSPRENAARNEIQNLRKEIEELKQELANARRSVTMLKKGQEDD